MKKRKHTLPNDLTATSKENSAAAAPPQGNRPSMDEAILLDALAFQREAKADGESAKAYAADAKPETAGAKADTENAKADTPRIAITLPAAEAGDKQAKKGGKAQTEQPSEAAAASDTEKPVSDKASAKADTPRIAITLPAAETGDKQAKKSGKAQTEQPFNAAKPQDDAYSAANTKSDKADAASDAAKAPNANASKPAADGEKGVSRKRKILTWVIVGVILLACAAIALLLTRGGELNAVGVRSIFISVQVTQAPEEHELTVDTTATPTALPTPTPSPTPTPLPTPEPTIHPENGNVLSPGMSAGVMKDIQIRLMELEYLDFDQPEELYDDGVRSAIIAFQSRVGLTATADIDAATYEALFSPDAPTYAVMQGDENDEVYIIEERLYELGYQTTEPNETFEADTANAVRRFRSRNSLAAGDTIDAAAFEVLLGEDTVSNYFGIGDKSDEIQSYQTLLYKFGYLVGTPDGVYGKLTAAAVRRYQEDKGLVVDGCLGQSTIAALKADNDAFYFVHGMQGDDVKHIQERLAHYGYLSTSQATGYFGDLTQAAVKAFQKRNSLTQDGKVGYKTLLKLNADNAKKAAATSSGSSGSGGSSSGGSSSGSGSSSSGGSSSGSSSSAGDSGTATGSTINYGQGVDAFIAIAQSKLGCRYVRGAKGPNTFDCSGFVYWCLNQAGVNQSYMTSTGWRSCSRYQRINSFSDLKRGDVLVFSGTGSGKGHVGIYLGDGRMIDAGSSAGKVVIRSSIYTNYWTKHFLMAYRIWD